MFDRATPNRLAAGAIVAPRAWRAVDGAPVPVLDPERLVHVQFRRFAGCPVCNLHLRSFVRRHGELMAAGVREVVVFHSPAAELRAHTSELPFAVIADPGRRLYAEFAVAAAPRALLDPRAWGPILRGIGLSLLEIVRHGRPMPALSPHGGRFGLPADFLIAGNGRLLAVKYGTHAYDQWSVEELLALARANPPARPRQLVEV